MREDLFLVETWIDGFSLKLICLFIFKMNRRDFSKELNEGQSKKACVSESHGTVFQQSIVIHNYYLNTMSHFHFLL